MNTQGDTRDSEGKGKSGGRKKKLNVSGRGNRKESKEVTKVNDYKG